MARIQRRNPAGTGKYPADATSIEDGDIVMINSAGDALPAAALASNQGCVGLAVGAVDNSGGSAGDLEVVVEYGEFLLPGTSMTKASNNQLVYAESNTTVDETAAANEPIAGVQTGVEGSNTWVKMGPGLALL